MHKILILVISVRYMAVRIKSVLLLREFELMPKNGIIMYATRFFDS